jgi:hypothetical protein
MDSGSRRFKYPSPLNSMTMNMVKGQKESPHHFLSSIVLVEYLTERLPVICPRVCIILMLKP